MKAEYLSYTQKQIKDRTFATGTLFIRVPDMYKLCLDKQKVKEAHIRFLLRIGLLSKDELINEHIVSRELNKIGKELGLEGD